MDACSASMIGLVFNYESDVFSEVVLTGSGDFSVSVGLAERLKEPEEERWSVE